MILILILFSFFNFSKVLSIFQIPDEHLEYFFKNNPKQYDLFCSNQQVNASILPSYLNQSFNCSRTVDQLKCWGYEDDLSCSKWKNRYKVKPCKFVSVDFLNNLKAFKTLYKVKEYHLKIF